jgi:hypothetical protein
MGSDVGMRARLVNRATPALLLSTRSQRPFDVLTCLHRSDTKGREMPGARGLEPGLTTADRVFREELLQVLVEMARGLLGIRAEKVPVIRAGHNRSAFTHDRPRSAKQS